MDKINAKTTALAVIPSVMLATSGSAFAQASGGGSTGLTTAVNTAKGTINSSVGDLAILLGAMLAVGAVVWVGFKLVRLLGR